MHRIALVCLVLFGCLADRAFAAEENSAAKVESSTSIPPWAKISESQIAAAKKLGVAVAWANEVGVKFVLIPPGEFMMGSAEDEEGRYPEEGPQHKVRIGRAYYVSIHQITQGQWKAVMGTTPWEGKVHAQDGPDNAVNHVCFNDTVRFCAAMARKDGKPYRLPTEAEWEYACRAGTTTRYSHGDDPKAEKLGDYAWYLGNTWFGDEQRYVHRVGMKKPNPWGLYDMLGNVWELCADVGHQNYEGAPADGSAWMAGDNGSRALRGGGLRSTDRRCRTASRYRYPREVGSYYVGFRIACEALPPDAGD